MRGRIDWSFVIPFVLLMAVALGAFWWMLTVIDGVDW